ncbi:SHOCT domain-containing protein [Halonotius roseus]|uniref:SHOCT domain-containing protein n=1 Tax=Halonotius roseus TaxID=2511997 RepID=A0A544QNH3_9EURY|nr:SHOCT domain-containing protein [Halonotius roseus]TQQ80458.1 SHOCT domain-containing protein [Halonotius roseus]
MSEWSSWIQTHPIQAAGLGLIAGVAGLSALGVLLVPIFIIASADPVLGLFAVVVVAMAGVASARHRYDGAAATQSPDPVAELEHRYVNGDISEAEFERRLNTLMETDAALGRLTDDETETQQTEYETELT